MEVQKQDPIHSLQLSLCNFYFLSKGYKLCKALKQNKNDFFSIDSL